MLAPSYWDTQTTTVPRSHYQSPIPLGTAQGPLSTSWYLCLCYIVHLIVTATVFIVIIVAVLLRQLGSSFVILRWLARTVYASISLFGACTGLLLRTAAAIKTLACSLVVLRLSLPRRVAMTLSNWSTWPCQYPCTPWSLARTLILLPS